MPMQECNLFCRTFHLRKIFSTALIVCCSSYLIVEEVDGVLVETKRQGLEEGNVIGHNLLVREIKLVNYDRVDMVVGQQIIWKKH